MTIPKLTNLSDFERRTHLLGLLCVAAEGVGRWPGLPSRKGAKA